jgi:outer membrane protein assembly factor BamB
MAVIRASAMLAGDKLLLLEGLSVGTFIGIRMPRRRGAALLVALVGAALTVSSSSAMAAAGDWSQLGFGSAHNAYQPNETTLSAGSISRLRWAWHRNVGSIEIGTPAVVGGVAYVGVGLQSNTTTSSLVALDLSSGRTLWTRSLSGSAGGDSAPAVADGLVYITTDAAQAPGTGSTLWAVNASNGTVRWSATGLSDERISSPVYADGMVFVSSFGGPANSVWLRAFDATTGALRWLSIETGWENPTGTPAVARGRVFVAAGAVVAFDEATGQHLWTSLSGIANPYKGELSVAGGRVFAPTRSGLYALDAATGSTLWRLAPTRGVPERAPAVHRGIVYAQLIGGTTTRLVALRTADGSQIWSRLVFTSPRSYDTVAAAPALANGLVYVGAPTPRSYGLYVYRASNGHKLHKNGMGSGAGRIFGGPVVSHGMVLVASQRGGVYAFELGPLAATKRP